MMTLRKNGLIRTIIIFLATWPALGQAQQPLSLQPPSPTPSGPRSTSANSLPLVNVPLPPVRPASLKNISVPASANAPQQGTVTPAAGPLSLASAPIAPLSDKAAVERVNAHFNSFGVLSGDFVQTGPDGRRIAGKIYIQKPGRLRFDYAPPSRLEIIADGTSVAIRDRKLNTQDIYPLSQTPLKFLLNERIDLSKDTRVTSVSSKTDGIRVTVEDKSTLGGTSQITIDYDPKSDRLKQWTVIDPQGTRTIVSLANLDLSARPSAALFRINFERVLEDRR
jgi:outer membrane lipoprotein-sorting protein